MGPIRAGGMVPPFLAKPGNFGFYFFLAFFYFFEEKNKGFLGIFAGQKNWPVFWQFFWHFIFCQKRPLPPGAAGNRYLPYFFFIKTNSLIKHSERSVILRY